MSDFTQLSSGDPSPRDSAYGALRQRDAFELLVQSVKDSAILILDIQGRVVSWNEGAKLIKGYGDHGSRQWFGNSCR